MQVGLNWEIYPTSDRRSGTRPQDELSVVTAYDEILAIYLFDNSTWNAFMYLICTFLHSDIQKFFGDEYYGENEEQKPQFDDDDDLAGSIVSLYT